MNFKSLNKTIFRVFVFSVIVISVVLIGIDARGFGSAAVKYNYAYIPLILALVLLNYIFRFIKWNFYLRQVGVNISQRESFFIFLSIIPMGITPGKLGEFLKSYLLKTKFGYPISLTSPTVITERLTDSIGMVILAGVGMLAFSFGAGVLIFVIMIIVMALIILQSKKLCYGVIGLVARIPYIRKYAAFLTNFYESACSLLRIRVLAVGIILGITAWLFEGLIVYFAVKGTGVAISVTYSIFILAMSSVIGAISMLPGGVVVSEGSMLGMLLRTGLFQKGTANLVVLLIRFATMWLGVAVGSIALLKMEKRLFGERYSEVEILDAEK